MLVLLFEQIPKLDLRFQAVPRKLSGERILRTTNLKGHRMQQEKTMTLSAAFVILLELLYCSLLFLPIFL